MQEEKDFSEQREELENQMGGGNGPRLQSERAFEGLSPSSNGQLPSIPSPTFQRRLTNQKCHLVSGCLLYYDYEMLLVNRFFLN